MVWYRGTTYKATYPKLHTSIACIYFIAKEFLTAMKSRMLLGAGSGQLTAASYLPRYFCFLNVISRTGVAAVCANPCPPLFKGYFSICRNYSRHPFG
ncbi:hypothetical protein GGE35_000309 [Rhizobium cellulosilyticum]|uniref:Uncharacterized protein n=1 Tax=Aliirhizobium cellulosilyticum TaxID=393664 RepID=A0A7W6X8N4_9HYPH|nr:hypothetical protein [Rhizobium cellulosilyticum]MBB4409840.1 hypothetical protein [Rhizobium cellulosilyticum]MBB4444527.1 hypothetical protein [Rhizobium cellulosilyticum]